MQSVLLISLRPLFYPFRLIEVEAVVYGYKYNDPDNNKDRIMSIWQRQLSIWQYLSWLKNA